MPAYSWGPPETAEEKEEMEAEEPGQNMIPPPINMGPPSCMTVWLSARVSAGVSVSPAVSLPVGVPLVWGVAGEGLARGSGRDPGSRRPPSGKETD